VSVGRYRPSAICIVVTAIDGAAVANANEGIIRGFWARGRQRVRGSQVAEGQAAGEG
jgi:hypothetical protein